MYESFLDSYNQYTCGYWQNGEDLNEAQLQKMEMLCEKLHLTSEDHLLDIGCGWGGFAKYAAETRGCKVTGITISREQARYARQHTEHLPGVKILEMDYRDLMKKEYKEQFSKIVIVGMVEHVGYRNYPKIMRVSHYCLKKTGILLLHTIAGLKSVKHTDPWIEENIFRNSMLPSLKQIFKAVEKLFKPNDMQNIGFDYDPTLMAWYSNFVQNWDKVKDDYYNDRFFRTMEYYFLSCAAAARVGKNQLYQIVFTKDLMMKYKPVR
jgi:cyclopropane-fatty-acyl-phospholipid synthase